MFGRPIHPHVKDKQAKSWWVFPSVLNDHITNTYNSWRLMSDWKKYTSMQLSMLNPLGGGSVIMSKISDHFPCLVKLEILNDKPKRPKYIQKRVISEAATHNFREELRSSDISSHLNANLLWTLMKNIFPITVWKWTNININFLCGSQQG